MSQYPQNYPSPQPPIGYMHPMPPPDPRGPAKRAGTLMIVIGSLGLLCGVCFGAMSFLPFDQIMAQSGQRPPLPPGMSLSSFIVIMKITAALVLVGSAAELLLGIFVRRGTGGVIMSALVFSVLATGYFLLNAVGSVVMGGGGNPLAALVMGFVLVGVFVTQIVLLIRARQAAPFVQRAGADYQAQYVQYMQQQQLYQQPMPPPPNFQAAPPPPPTGYAGSVGYGQSAYNAPAAGTTPGAAATGWQWPATQAPPPPPSPPEQTGEASNGEGSPPA